MDHGRRTADYLVLSAVRRPWSNINLWKSILKNPLTV
jgi:hypothetical protein